MEQATATETGCCPRFDPAPWDEKEQTWNERIFLRDRVRCFLYIPLNFGAVVRRLMEKIEQADAWPPEPLTLADCCSPWHTDLYVQSAREIEGVPSTRLSGKFLTKVFDGPYSQTGKWIKAMRAFAAERGQPARKMYFYYTTCPKCAKVYGKNYTVVVAEV